VLQPHDTRSIPVAIAASDDSILATLSRTIDIGSDLFASGAAADQFAAKVLLRDRSLRVLVVCLSSRADTPPQFDVTFVADAKRARPDIGILVVAHECDKHAMRAALDVGATACALIGASREHMLGAIRAVSLGVTWLDREIAEVVFRTKTTHSPVPVSRSLTQREQTVLHLIAEGYSNGEMATALRCATGTIDTHVTHVFRKLGVNDRVSAAVLALRQGLILEHTLQMKRAHGQP
jgi:two-component system, NarL family, response regulator LiaR